MRSKPGFDVCDRHSGGEGRKRSAERARRVALDDKQVRRIGKRRKQDGSDFSHMLVRVNFAGAVEQQG